MEEGKDKRRGEPLKEREQREREVEGRVVLSDRNPEQERGAERLRARFPGVPPPSWR